MRHVSMFFALVLAPIALPAQTSSTLYSPARPTQACPVYMAAHRIGGLTATIQADAPTLNEEDKRMNARVLELKEQIDALKAQKADLRAKFDQNPNAAASTDLQHQLNDLDLQIKERQMETDQLTAHLSLEQSRRSSTNGYTPTQGLDLNIVGIGPRSVVAVDILVHGFSNQGRLMPASQIPNATVGSPYSVSAGPSDLDRNRSGNSAIAAEPTQSFHLTRSGSESAIHTSIAASGMMGISWLEVTHVEFADGSTWQPAGGQSCHFAPSLYVPVNLTTAPAR